MIHKNKTSHETEKIVRLDIIPILIEKGMSAVPESLLRSGQIQLDPSAPGIHSAFIKSLFSGKFDFAAEFGKILKIFANKFDIADLLKDEDIRRI